MLAVELGAARLRNAGVIAWRRFPARTRVNLIVMPALSRTSAGGAASDASTARKLACLGGRRTGPRRRVMSVVVLNVVVIVGVTMVVIGADAMTPVVMVLPSAC